MPTVADARDGAAKGAQQGIEAAISDAMEAAASLYEASGRVDIPDDHRQRVSEALLALWGDAIRQSGRSTIDEFKDFEVKQDEESFFDRILGVFAEVFGGRKITQVSDTTRQQVSNIVLQGQRAGLGLREVAKSIRDASASVSKQRAALIARTEAHGASNYAVNEVAKTARRPLMKEWVAVEDSRTRDFGEGDGVVDEYSHRRLHGERVPMDQAFKVPDRNGGYTELMFPGDPNGAPGAVINCRCVLAYVRAE